MKHNSNAITTAGFIAAGAVSLCYLVPLAIVHPIPQLLAAIGVEVIWFVALVAMRIHHMVSVRGRAQDAVIAEITNLTLAQLSAGSLYRGRQLWRKTLVVAMCAVLALVLVDLSAYLSAFCGARQLSQAIYSAAPVSCLIGLNPAATLEILGGAYVESGKYQQSLPLFAEIEQVRLHYFGAESQKMAAIYADYGDLYTKMRANDLAEQYYKKSIDLANKLLGYSGTGRAYTRLGNLLAAQGRLDEAADNYKRALQMRTKQFGPDSAKVAETLFAYAIVLDRQGKTEAARQSTTKAQEILDRVRKQNKDINYTPVALLAVSLIVSWLLLGKQGYLTRLAIQRLKAKIDNNDYSGDSRADSGDIKTLILLYQYQKNTVEMQKYKDLAATVAEPPGKSTLLK